MANSMRAGADHAALDTDAVCVVIARFLGVARKRLTATTLLVQDLGIDSIDLMALAIELEEEFDVVLTDRDLLRMHTIGETMVCIVGVMELRRSERESRAGMEST